ncbi:hypothetical protein BV22DRAFT_1131520 [Leucogyrophana mollusca]|uniref:Uncharacterized protein n=1 Tax=Leucogyrophana mollusca TaxID=85980 RepID=A0ACB8B9E7_9AGAM|nr:hypothetical protein BV22DRAFT_1131520 [Leucogyrophana mollusca]
MPRSSTATTSLRHDSSLSRSAGTGASDFDTITWMKKTTTVEETVVLSRTPRQPPRTENHLPPNVPLAPPPAQHSPPPIPPSLPSSAGRARISRPSVHAVGIPVPPEQYVPYIPRPDEIALPAPGLAPEGYWVITVGQEVGIFYHWVDVAERTNRISGSVQKKYHSFENALRIYTNKWRIGKLEPVPIYAGPFWPVLPTDDQPSPATSTASSDSLWQQLDDMSVQMSQVEI